MNSRSFLIAAAAAVLVATPVRPGAGGSASASVSQATSADSAAAGQQAATDATAGRSSYVGRMLADRGSAWRNVSILVLVLGLAATGGWLAYRRVVRGSAKWDDGDGRSVPPLLMPLRPEGSRRISWEAGAAARAEAAAHTAREAVSAADAPHENSGAHDHSPTHDGGTGFTDISQQSESVQAGPIRFHRPPDGTLQLLPGRLEILSGSMPEEIRFVKLTGRDPVITFGRSEGEPHSHIQLTAPTVSRVHASMRFIDGRWEIRNLSTTNPATVNGSPLGLNGSGAKLLSDGDTVEMGQVVFRFRAR